MLSYIFFVISNLHHRSLLYIKFFYSIKYEGRLFNAIYITY